MRCPHFILPLLGLLAGCAAHRPAPRVEHLVLVDLADPADLPAMRAESDRLLSGLPGVRRYVSGTPVETGRPEVSADYDLAILVEFDSVDDYRAWLASAPHRELGSKWRPRWKRATIVDFAP